MLVMKFRNFLFVANKNINNKYAIHLSNEHTEDPFEVLVKSKKESIIYIHNHYRLQGMPLKFISDIFFNNDKDRKKYKLNHPFDGTKLNGYYFEDCHDSRLAGIYINYNQMDNYTLGTIDYVKTPEGLLVPKENDDIYFCASYNDYITNRMIPYHNLISDLIMRELYNNIKSNESKYQIYHNVKSILKDKLREVLYQYNKLTAFPIEKGVLLDLAKLKEIKDGDELIDVIKISTIKSTPPEKSFDEKRKEYFEKKALEKVKNIKPKRTRKKKSE